MVDRLLPTLRHPTVAEESQIPQEDRITSEGTRYGRPPRQMRPAVERWMGERMLEWADQFFTRQGVWAVLVARLLPFVPFDPISFAAGLTSTPRLRFVAANLVGQVPATFIYSTLGSQLEDGKLPPGALLGLAFLAFVVLGVAAWRARRPGK
jgi:uncharacterized membrane protein YdjX (TVP38/TMEM64 family)